MANKRMFDKSILETDNFLNISLGAKALYFLLGMEADDEGFISPTRVLRLYGGEKGDLKNLIDVGLVIPFKSGVIVITDWNQNNWLDNRRIRPTQYQIEKKMLILTEQKRYVLSNGLASARLEESSIEESSIEEKRIDVASEQSSREITEIFEIFQKINPTINYGNKTQRLAVSEMIKKIGFQKTKDSALYAVSIQSQQYAPTITTPYQLKTKLGDLIAYHSKEKNKKDKIIAII